jgi:hypothetical protein
MRAPGVSLARLAPTNVIRARKSNVLAKQWLIVQWLRQARITTLHPDGGLTEHHGTIRPPPLFGIVVGQSHQQGDERT